MLPWLDCYSHPGKDSKSGSGMDEGRDRGHMVLEGTDRLTMNWVQCCCLNSWDMITAQVAAASLGEPQQLSFLMKPVCGLGRKQQDGMAAA